MAYTNETLHYGIPKPLGTDLTVPQDYNEAADAVDQALFDASTNSSEAVTAAANAVDAAADAVEEVGNLGTEVNSLKGRTSALETSDVIQNNKIDALENQGATKFDSVGIADPYVNGLTYSVGDVVTYNGQRYKCITAVVAAEPFDADKWSAEDVETVLDELKSDLTDIGNDVVYLEANSGKLGKGTFDVSGNYIATTNSAGTAVTIDLLKAVASDVSNITVNNIGVGLYKVTGGSTQSTTNEQAVISNGKIFVTANTTTFSSHELGYAGVTLNVTLS